MSDLLQIGEVAERVGLSLRTVRYYEEQGLLTPEKRSQGGFRLYTEAQIDRLLIIKQMKPLEFTVDEMREVLAAMDALLDPATSAAQRADHRERLRAYATAADERCAKLRVRLEGGEAFAADLARAADTTGASTVR